MHSFPFHYFNISFIALQKLPSLFMLSISCLAVPIPYCVFIDVITDEQSRMLVTEIYAVRIDFGLTFKEASKISTF
ncbi:hypothetical protein ACH3XW_34405 [Acanthocheilonema viteae]